MEYLFRFGFYSRRFLIVRCDSVRPVAFFFELYRAYRCFVSRNAHSHGTVWIIHRRLAVEGTNGLAVILQTYSVYVHHRRLQFLRFRAELAMTAFIFAQRKGGRGNVDIRIDVLSLTVRGAANAVRRR